MLLVYVYTKISGATSYDIHIPDTEFEEAEQLLVERENDRGTSLQYADLFEAARSHVHVTNWLPTSSDEASELYVALLDFIGEHS